MKADQVPQHYADIQAIVGTGFASSLPHCDYLLLRVTEPTVARAFIGQLLGRGLVKSVAELAAAEPDVATRPAHDDAAMLAFSYLGLRKLGVRDGAEGPFSTPFRDGMASDRRAALLGDALPSHWRWGDVRRRGTDQNQVDLLIAHYRASRVVGSDLLPDDASRSVAGCELIERVVACPSYIERTPADEGTKVFEPFGFRDGIGQPVIDGMPLSRAQRVAKERAGALHADRVVAPGEFMLGYENEYGEPAHCPEVIDCPRFGLNGSYLAVRQIAQDVDALRQFERQNPNAVEKMIGRTREGAALVQCPVAPPELDAFRYRVDDHDGLGCPRGAHVRRANPRDGLGWDVESGIRMSKLHRLLRRGRVYVGEHRPCQSGDSVCGHASYRESCGRGLFFMALNADLDRQFEFIQQRWIANRGFADLRDEDDPLLGHAGRRAFSVPALPVGRRLEGFGPFTDVIGGGYFFVPGIAALQFIARI